METNATKSPYGTENLNTRDVSLPSTTVKMENRSFSDFVKIKTEQDELIGEIETKHESTYGAVKTEHRNELSIDPIKVVDVAVKSEQAGGFENQVLRNEIKIKPETIEDRWACNLINVLNLTRCCFSSPIQNVSDISCRICDFQAKSKNSLKHHIRSAHRHGALSEIKRYRCGLCDCRVNDERDLDKHSMSIHGKLSKKYMCDRCDYKATRKSGLRSHVITIHQMYRCDKCTYRAILEDDMQRHVISVHEKASNAKWYRCRQCKYKAKREIQFYRHMLTHNEPSDTEMKRYE
ncbi:hypothetical protein NQ315_017017 [Exocentrus adspersus]|uniref:C2H2-type domain-containing protein n=1 Tax=Exocentrus adspersus TaxID=1586481 RepID=A0AAV8VBM4_9CUCU|nr:hypothetical protein NQ315_017017 [Exocentrus adspersus]